MSFWEVYFIIVLISFAVTALVAFRFEDFRITLKGLFLWLAATFIPILNVFLVIGFCIIAFIAWFKEGDDIILWERK